MKAKFSLAAILALQMSAAFAAPSPFEVSENIALKGTVPMSLLNSRADMMAALKTGSVLALNQDSYLGGVKYSAATEFIVGAGGELYAVTEDSTDPIATGVHVSTIPMMNFTMLETDAATGEIGDFNIPGDFQVAGKGGHKKKRRGVTNCYHVAKAILGRRIRLTGVAAASAAPQLQAAGWQRYDYENAPKGSACVFAPGGDVTSSGGHIYGHIGIVGHGGVVSPAAGFALHRPFLGCFKEA